MIPKGRLDALTDGIFAFAMTLLVLDLRLPDGFAPVNSAELLQGLFSLTDNLIAYVISFWVLALRWLGQTRIRGGAEEAGASYAGWTVLHLFFITFIPFSTMVVGHYGNLPPAVWLYALNIVASSAITWRLSEVARAEGRIVRQAAPIGLVVILASAILSVIISLIAPRWAMYAYFLNLLAAPLGRWQRRRQKPAEPSGR